MHFLDRNWILNSCILVTRQVGDRHTGENLAKHLRDVKDEFAVAEISAMTTDNASNSTVAARHTGYGHVRCFAYTGRQ